MASRLVMRQFLRTLTPARSGTTPAQCQFLTQKTLPITSSMVQNDSWQRRQKTNLAARLRERAAKLNPTAPPAMFCFQCEQTKKRKGCTAIGVCGKTPQVAHLQDLLIYVMKGLAIYGHRASLVGVTLDDGVYDFTFSAFFSTLTNVNFDPQRFRGYITQAVALRDKLREDYENACKEKGLEPITFSDGPAVWKLPSGADLETLEEEGKKHGVQSEIPIYGEDVHGVRQMIIYGLKGMSTYARHATVLGQNNSDVGKFVLDAFSFLETGNIDCGVSDAGLRKDLGHNLSLALKLGEQNLLVMERLDRGHREQFGAPVPTEVATKPTAGKCILVSGHDMHDLYHILQATEGSGINVYTHGEMLPAHGYPGLKKFKHLVGHYGGAWQNQQYEFPAFPGAIIITTNCMIEPKKSYQDRLYTLNDCGWPGIRHIDVTKDMDVVINKANALQGFKGTESGQFKPLTVGFGRDVLVDNADKVLEAVNSGDLRRIFVVGGCDGAEHKRNYFSTLVESLPKDTIVLTMGCAKYRFNKMDLGNLGDSGLPRLFDMGQCNDSYGAVVVASALAKALDTDVNSLPMSIALSWFEQKAVAVLLSLLHLGIQNIRLGPVLPAFVTPTVLNILVDKFKISAVDVRHPKEDLKILMGEA